MPFAAALALLVNVSGTPGGSYSPALVLTSDRGGPRALVAWHDFTSTPHAIWSASPPAAAAPVSVAAGPALSPRIASDAAGLIHLAWRSRASGTDAILHSVLRDGTWSPAMRVSQGTSPARHPQLALDPWGGALIAWEQDDRVLAARRRGPAWGAAAALPIEAPIPDTLRLAFDGFGTLHATWAAGDPADSDVFHATRPDGGAWSHPENLSDSPGSYSAEPALAVEPSGSVHVAWVEQDAVSGAFAEICASAQNGGAWSAPAELSHVRRDAFRPSIALGHDGDLRLAFASGPLGRREILFVRDAGSVPRRVSDSETDATLPQLVLDDLDRPWIAWQEGRPPSPEIVLAAPAR